MHTVNNVPKKVTGKNEEACLSYRHPTSGAFPFIDTMWVMLPGAMRRIFQSFFAWVVGLRMWIIPNYGLSSGGTLENMEYTKV